MTSQVTNHTCSRLLILRRGQALFGIPVLQQYQLTSRQTRTEFIVIDLYHELESCGPSKQRK
jgi:hypothetical protein